MDKHTKLNDIMEQLGVSNTKARDILEVSEYINSEDYRYCKEIQKILNIISNENYVYAEQLYDYAKENDISDYYMAHKNLKHNMDSSIIKKIKKKFELETVSPEDYEVYKRYVDLDNISIDNLPDMKKVSSKHGLSIEEVNEKWYGYYELLSKHDYLDINMLKKADTFVKTIFPNIDNKYMKYYKDENKESNYKELIFLQLQTLEEIVSDEKNFKLMNLELPEIPENYKMLYEKFQEPEMLKKVIGLHQNHNISIEDLITNWRENYEYFIDREWMTVSKMNRARLLSEINTPNWKENNDHYYKKARLEFLEIIKTEKNYEEALRIFKEQ
ncbi:MAG: hypothetical protein Q8J85_07115 [Sulfuricurvum sp.]|nr:hypothetical protein [Sulfuricurvum sp.]MDP3023004.1 hypothetical protein [Sulfuricurvum sp.]